MIWPTLTPPTQPDGYVLAGVSRPDTVAAVTRVAVLMSHYYGAQPLALHVALGEKPQWEGRVDLEGERLFDLARSEAAALGYPLASYTEFASEIAAGILGAAESVNPRVVVLGHSYGRGSSAFVRIADSAGRYPLIVTRFSRSEDFGRVLVPTAEPADVEPLLPLLSVLEEIGCEVVLHQTTLTADAVLEAVDDDDLIVLRTADCAVEPSAPSCARADQIAERTDRPILLVRGDLRPEANAA